MIDLTPTLVKALNTILPTHYELKLSSGTKSPCISYQERDNSAQETGNTRGYSRISYTIKVWGNDLEQLNKYAQQIDNTLRPLGWKRTSVNELYSYQSAIIQKIMAYEILCYETFE